MLGLFLVGGTSGLTTPPAVRDLPRMGRRAAVGGGLLAFSALPAPSYASYALYSASETTMAERKATGDWQRSIGSDTETLESIQANIVRKRPQAAQSKRAPQYCAGQTSAVSPLLENRCGIIGVSKADQSNALTDSYGNMNVGVYNSLSGQEKARVEARQAMIREAADNARLRQEAVRNRY